MASYSRTLSPPLSLRSALRCALRCVVLPPPSLRVLALRMPCVQSARSRAFAGDWRGIGVQSAGACPRLQTGQRQAWIGCPTYAHVTAWTAFSANPQQGQFGA